MDHAKGSKFDVRLYLYKIFLRMAMLNMYKLYHPCYKNVDRFTKEYYTKVIKKYREKYSVWEDQGIETTYIIPFYAFVYYHISEPEEREIISFQFYSPIDYYSFLIHIILLLHECTRMFFF